MSNAFFATDVWLEASVIWLTLHPLKALALIDNREPGKSIQYKFSHPQKASDSIVLKPSGKMMDDNCLHSLNVPVRIDVILLFNLMLSIYDPAKAPLMSSTLSGSEIFFIFLQSLNASFPILIMDSGIFNLCLR